MTHQMQIRVEPTFFHNEKWLSLLQANFGYTRHDLSGSSWSAPLLEVRGLLGNRFVSVPFSDYGGPAGHIDIEDLCRQAWLRLRDTACEYLELRVTDNDLKKSLNALGFMDSAHYTTRLLDAQEGNVDWLWENSLSKTAKRYVKKASREGVAVSEITTKSELERGYNAYFRAVKQLGSPCHSEKFFLSLKDSLGPLCRMFLATHAGKEVGVASFIVGNNRLHLWLIYCLEEYKKLGAVYLLDWVGITLAHDLGLKYFDFGRTRVGSGVESYKHHWKGQDHEIHHIALYKSKVRAPPDPSQTKFRIYSTVWRALPDPVVKWLGPKAIRSIAL